MWKTELGQTGEEAKGPEVRMAAGTDLTPTSFSISHLFCVSYDLKLRSKTSWYFIINQKKACAKLLGLFSLHVGQNWKPQPRENSGSVAARFTPSSREAP